MTDETVTTTDVVEKKPTHTVLDNSDLAAVLADARGEPRPDKPADKVETKAESKDEVEAEEDENGLTPEDRKELTEKMQKAIGKKHRALMTEKEFAQAQFAEKQAALRETEKLRRENERLKEQLTPKAVEEDKEPDRTNFKTDKEYSDAMIDYRVDQKLKAKAEADHKKALEDRQREVIVEATARIDAARELVPDFQEVMESAADVEVPVSIAGYMQESEMFAELGYHLAKNPEVLENLAKLSPAKQLVAIGKIESTLKPFSDKTEKVTTAKAESEDGKAKADPSTNAKPASKARPEPIKPLETGSASLVEKDPSEMTYEETFSRFQKTHKVNLKARQRH